MPDPLLEIENLSVSFAVGGVLQPAVKDLTLALHPGEIVGVVGESGSGKSTALFAVMSYLPGNAVIESGRVLHGGVDLLRARRETLDDIRGRRVAMIYQDPATALNPAMTVGAQIGEVLARHLPWPARAPGSARTSCCAWSSSTTRRAWPPPIRISSAAACSSG